MATTAYLSATLWAPSDDLSESLEVVGGRVNGTTTAGNLLNVALLNLITNDRIALEQIRPYEVERAGGVLGGRSFMRLLVLDHETELPGLEGAILGVARSRPRTGLGGAADAAVDRIAREDPDGLRGVVLGLDLDRHRPWQTIGGLCLGEAAGLGIVRIEGRFRKRLVVANEPALAAVQRSYVEELRPLRRRHRERHEELDNAVLADCLQALHWAHNRTSPGI